LTIFLAQLKVQASHDIVVLETENAFNFFLVLDDHKRRLNRGL
jgi:hypothetical protein